MKIQEDSKDRVEIRITLLSATLRGHLSFSRARTESLLSNAVNQPSYSQYQPSKIHSRDYDRPCRDNSGPQCSEFDSNHSRRRVRNLSAQAERETDQNGQL